MPSRAAPTPRSRSAASASATSTSVDARATGSARARRALGGASIPASRTLPQRRATRHSSAAQSLLERAGVGDVPARRRRAPSAHALRHRRPRAQARRDRRARSRPAATGVQATQPTPTGAIMSPGPSRARRSVVSRPSSTASANVLGPAARRRGRRPGSRAPRDSTGRTRRLPSAAAVRRPIARIEPRVGVEQAGAPSRETGCRAHGASLARRFASRQRSPSAVRRRSCI